ncbi:MAG: hypothetical protein ACRCSF_11995 [Mycobacteriaceae bacterium]
MNTEQMNADAPGAVVFARRMWLVSLLLFSPTVVYFAINAGKIKTALTTELWAAASADPKAGMSTEQINGLASTAPVVFIVVGFLLAISEVGLTALMIKRVSTGLRSVVITVALIHVLIVIIGRDVIFGYAGVDTVLRQFPLLQSGFLAVGGLALLLPSVSAWLGPSAMRKALTAGR